jgi:hypothetical protein
MDALRASTAFLPVFNHHRRDDRANQADRTDCDLRRRARLAFVQRGSRSGAAGQD